MHTLGRCANGQRFELRPVRRSRVLPAASPAFSIAGRRASLEALAFCGYFRLRRGLTGDKNREGNSGFHPVAEKTGRNGQRDHCAMPPHKPATCHAEIWSAAKAASFRQRMETQLQEWLAMVDSNFFPDWAQEEIIAQMDKNMLDLSRLSGIMDEARGDMFDLQELARAPDVQETWSLTQLEQYFRRYDALIAPD